jgi:hypothetical protein
MRKDDNFLNAKGAKMFNYALNYLNFYALGGIKNFLGGIKNFLGGIKNFLGGIKNFPN